MYILHHTRTTIATDKYLLTKVTQAIITITKYIFTN